MNDNALPFVATVDDRDSPGDLIETLALAPFVAGEQPWARSVHLARVNADARLLPEGVDATHGWVQPGNTSHLATGDGWTLRAIRWKSAGAWVVVTAVTDALATAILAAATEGAEEPIPDETNATSIGFWHLGAGGGVRTARMIEAPTWADIRRNYASGAVTALDRLMGLEPGKLNGRIVLLHGPPGTGKTTALRALALRWRRWCQVDYVLDPDRLLRNPAYLIDVALHDDDDDDLLHPAVIRPGRCLAEIHVGRLPRAEAIDWLGSSKGIGRDGSTWPSCAPFATTSGR